METVIDVKEILPLERLERIKDSVINISDELREKKLELSRANDRIECLRSRNFDLYEENARLKEEFIRVDSINKTFEKVKATEMKELEKRHQLEILSLKDKLNEVIEDNDLVNIKYEQLKEEVGF